MLVAGRSFIQVRLLQDLEDRSPDGQIEDDGGRQQGSPVDHGGGAQWGTRAALKKGGRQLVRCCWVGWRPAASSGETERDTLQRASLDSTLPPLPTPSSSSPSSPQALQGFGDSRPFLLPPHLLLLSTLSRQSFPLGKGVPFSQAPLLERPLFPLGKGSPPPLQSFLTQQQSMRRASPFARGCEGAYAGRGESWGARWIVRPGGASCCAPSSPSSPRLSLTHTSRASPSLWPRD